MIRGFKKYARELALEVRGEIGLNAFARFDPYALAVEYGIPVYQLSKLANSPKGKAAYEHYAKRKAIFSAALVPLGSRRFILDNDIHAVVRRRNSISHEMSHLLLEHKFSQVLLTNDGCRAFNKDSEDEADWLAGELLIPYVAAERAAKDNWTDEEVADTFHVSQQLAAMRMNRSGARIVIARRRAYARNKVS